MASTKLLQLRPEVVRTKEYVVAFGPQDSLDKPCPYDCIAIGSAAAIKLAKAGRPVVAIYLSPGETVSDLVPPEMLIGVDSVAAADELEGRNFVVLDDETFSASYSHVKEADGAGVIGLKRLAGILHYKYVRIIPGLGAFVPKLHLMVQLWKPKQNRRLKELITCLHKNLENPLIQSVNIFVQEGSGLDVSYLIKDLPLELRQKVVRYDSCNRFTYKDIMNHLSNMGNPEDIVGFANADIFFDETIRELWNIDLRDRCISLLRHDCTSTGVESAKLYGFAGNSIRDDSQDAWFFRSGSLREHRDNGESWTSMDFEIGRAGCHNCFAGELVRRRWLLGNPALSIKAYHLHESPERTYNETDLVTRGVYATVAPCGIMESALLRQNAFANRTAVKVMDTLVPKVEPWLSSDSAPYERGIKSVMTGLKQSVDANTTNKERTYHIITTDNVCITPEGLISSGAGIGFGLDVDASELLWAQTTFSSVTSTTTVDATVFFPSDDSSQSFGQQLWNAARAATLWSLGAGAKRPLKISGPEPLPAMKTYLNFLGVEYIEGALSVKGEARGLLPDSANQRLLEPIVKKLRSAFCETLLGDIVVKPGQWTTVNCEEDLSQKLHNAHALDPNSWLGKYMRTFRESEVVVINHSNAIPNLWMMHEGSLVLDIKPTLNAARMATACDLRYMPFIFDSDIYSKQEIARILLKAVDGFKPAASTGPKIYVPAVRSDGFHKHLGDGFRELVELWHEGGLCTRIFHDGVFCWYGSVGDTLLYDRRGNEWLTTDVPEGEKEYKKLLILEDFMNWARRPRLLEDMTPSSGRRTKNLVFYGHIETARHFRARSSKATGVDWSTACDSFALPVGSKYEYTQTEYLNRIKDSYYGLCLPGHGPKTNREVEYMALGVVPIFVGAKPSAGLRKGKHYFEAATPEEAISIVKQAQSSSMAAMDLDTMSKTCRSFYEDNWSPLNAWKLLESKLL